MAKQNSAGEKPATKSSFLLPLRTGKGTKVYYTREDDEMIVKMMKGGKTTKQIADKIGHSAASVTYRVTRVLSLMHSFNEYDYDKRELNLTADQKVERKAQAQKEAAAASK